MALARRFDEARHEAEATFKYYLPTSRTVRNTRRFLRLFEDGPERTARVLRTWEEMMVRRIGITQYWQPTY